MTKFDSKTTTAVALSDDYVAFYAEWLWYVLFSACSDDPFIRIFTWLIWAIEWVVGEWMSFWESIIWWPSSSFATADILHLHAISTSVKWASHRHAMTIYSENECVCVYISAPYSAFITHICIVDMSQNERDGIGRQFFSDVCHFVYCLLMPLA